MNYIALDPLLINNLKDEHYNKNTEQPTQDLRDYYEKLEIPLSDSDFSFLLPIKDIETPMERFLEDPPEEQMYETVLPFYPLSIAAGGLMDSIVTQTPESWFVVEGCTSRRVFSSQMFVAQILGKSMEPIISDGAFCLFTFEVGGSRNGRIVLAQKADISDQDTGASYTIKYYHSTKTVEPDTGWRHESISLKPANSDYKEIVIDSTDAGDFNIVAFFLEVLDAKTS